MGVPGVMWEGADAKYDQKGYVLSRTMTSRGLDDFNIRLPHSNGMRDFDSFLRDYGIIQALVVFLYQVLKEDISSIRHLIVPYPIVVYHGG